MVYKEKWESDLLFTILPVWSRTPDDGDFSFRLQCQKCPDVVAWTDTPIQLLCEECQVHLVCYKIVDDPPT